MQFGVPLHEIRTRLGLKWGVPEILLAFWYLGIALLLSAAAQNDGPGWLNILVLVAIWSAWRMLWIGPVIFARLARACSRDSAQRRAIGKAATTEQGEPHAGLVLAKGR